MNKRRVINQCRGPGPGPHPDVLIRDNLFALDAHLNEINDYSTVGAWTQ